MIATFVFLPETFAAGVAARLRCEANPWSGITLASEVKRARNAGAIAL
jgi:hypothetical protein